MSGRLLATPATLAVTLLLLAGCTTSRESARDLAITRVTTKAESLRNTIAAAAAGTSGEPQLEAVQKVLPDLPLVAAAEGEGVMVGGSITATAHAGGGLTYEQFTARLCLRYRVTAVTGATDVAETPCPKNVDAVAPADETVSLAG